MAGAVTGVAVTALLILALGSWFGDDGPPAALDAPSFVEETDSAGIDHVYDGGFEFFVGGGVAVFDCDVDGLPDVYVAGGENEASLYRNMSDPGGALRFVRVETPRAELRGVTGAYPLDVDDDTIADLAVLRVGENVMLRGLGDCGFSDAGEWAVDGGDDWTVAFSATWEDGAVRPTLAFGNYIRPAETPGSEAGCEDHWLFRPAEGSSVYGEPTILAPGWCTLSMLFSDWSGTGQRDLRATNDRHYYRDGQEQLWRIEAGQAPRPYAEDEGWQRMQIWGMGIASHDVTGDGVAEVFLTSQGDNKLQTLADGTGAPRYEDIAFGHGATAHRPHTGDTTLPSTAWHPEFDDVNNDGYIDLFISKGNVDAQADHAADDPNNLLIGGPSRTFTEAATQAGVADNGRSRGAAVVDLNLDGMLDLIVVDRREPVKVWRNVGSGTAADPTAIGRWLTVRLDQPAPNRGAVGAWIEVDTGTAVQRREMTIGGGHASGQLGWTHFGLGASDSASVRVVWPDGETGPWMEIPADRWVTVSRDEPEPTIEALIG